MPLPRSLTRPTPTPTRQPPNPTTLHTVLGWVLGLTCLVLGAIALLNQAPTRVTVGLCLMALAALPCSPLPGALRWAAGGLGLALG